MKAKLLICLLAFAVTAWAADESKPAPTMPSEVTLTSGRVLRNVQVVRWESGRVVLKHEGGANTVPYSGFRSPTPAEIVTIRNVNSSPAAARSGNDGLYRGQVFVVTKEGTRYIEGAVIWVLPEEAWPRVQSNNQPKLMPRPLTTLRSNQEGRFEFNVPSGKRFFLLAQGSLKLDLSNTEHYEWRMRSSSLAPGEEIQLTSENDYGTVHTYAFE